jgi:hypothetical protein
VQQATHGATIVPVFCYPQSLAAAASQCILCSQCHPSRLNVSLCTSHNARRSYSSSSSPSPLRPHSDAAALQACRNLCAFRWAEHYVAPLQTQLQQHYMVTWLRCHQCMSSVTVTFTVFGTAKRCNPQGSQRLMGSTHFNTLWHELLHAVT